MSLMHFEDVGVGDAREFGAKTITREEIVAFAEQFDPQPHHLDEEAAKETMLGTLCASGWHICCILMRLLCDHVVNQSASLGGAGIDEVRWKTPLLPGDTVRVRSTFMEKRQSASKPYLGICKIKHELLNQRDEVVMEQTGTFLLAVRAHLDMDAAQSGLGPTGAQ